MVRDRRAIGRRAPRSPAHRELWLKRFWAASWRSFAMRTIVPRENFKIVGQVSHCRSENRAPTILGPQSLRPVPDRMPMWRGNGLEMPRATPFDGEVTLVTGGASGIGARLCLSLAQPGRAFVVHTGANRSNAEKVAARITDKGGVCHIVVEDFSRPGAGSRVAEETIAAFGRIRQRRTPGCLRRSHQIRRANRGRPRTVDFDASEGVLESHHHRLALSRKRTEGPNSHDEFLSDRRFPTG